MKRYFYILFLFVLSLEACYEDKGNYDYDPIAPIEMKGINSEYTVYCMIDTLHINPQFQNKENYDFLWTMFSNTIVQAPVDTISREPELHHRIVEGSDVYTVVLTVINRNNGDRQSFTTQVAIYTQFSKGCYILKEVDGATDIDLLTPESKLVENILEGTSARVAGKPMAFTVCPDINYIDDNGEAQSRVTTVWICSDQDARMLRLDDMTPVYDIHTMFYEEMPNESPRNIFISNNLVYLSNNGCYNLALLVPTAMHKFGYPLRVSNASEGTSDGCSCSKYGILKQSYYMFYDERNGRFLSVNNGIMKRFLDVDQKGNPVNFPYSSNNMDCDLIYMGNSAANGYALMRDRKNQQYMMYKLETAEYDKYDGYLFSPLLKVLYLTSANKIVSGETFGSNETYAFTYFSIGNQLNFFDFTTDSGQEQLNILPGLEGNITLIKHLKIGVNEEYLVVATEQDGHYKLYFCKMIAGRPDLSKTPTVIEGEGKPVQIFVL